MMIDKIFQSGVMDEEQKKFKGVKVMNKGEELTQLTSYHSKLQKDGLMQMVLKVFTTSTKTPLNQDGHPKQLEYYGPLPCNHP
jgi:hypothetical protein